jgi:hypothetical protein
MHFHGFLMLLDRPTLISLRCRIKGEVSTIDGSVSLAAELVFDLQEQARQFIMPEPNFNGLQVGWVAPRRRR